MPHYYTNDSNLIDKDYTFDYDYKGIKYKFHSNNGVFSKERVDFGTNLLINSLPLFSNEKILDMGSGVGVISIVVSGANPNVTVLGADVNLKAIALANKNANLNSVKNVCFIESNLYENINESFDVIISNPPIRAGKKIVHGIVEDGFLHLNKGGRIYLVIQIKQGAPSLKAKVESIFGNCSVINKKNGYLILFAIREN